jgi:hypothetical protein
MCTKLFTTKHAQLINILRCLSISLYVSVFIYLCVCVFVCFSIHLNYCLSVYLTVHLSVCVTSVDVCQSVYTKPVLLVSTITCLSVYMSVCLAVYTFISTTASLPVCLSDSPSVSLFNECSCVPNCPYKICTTDSYPYVSVFLPVCLSVCLSVCFSIHLKQSICLSNSPSVLLVNGR